MCSKCLLFWHYFFLFTQKLFTFLSIYTRLHISRHRISVNRENWCIVDSLDRNCFWCVFHFGIFHQVACTVPVNRWEEMPFDSQVQCYECATDYTVNINNVLNRRSRGKWPISVDAEQVKGLKPLVLHIFYLSVNWLTVCLLNSFYHIIYHLSLWM